MVTIKKDLMNKANYGGTRSTIKYLVIHYTGNDGDTDEGNSKYFKGDRGVSAHYFVDSDSITQCVPDNYIAWHCGTTGTYKHKLCRNNNSIGIELCDDQKNGKVYPSAKTIQNALDLTKSLMQKYNIPAENVIRHYDVTGKKCPAYWVDDTAWKTAFWNRLKDVTGVEKYKKQVKDRFGLSDQTIEWLATYKYADSLFERLATKK
jgi:N-acetylmuramoyl-L-alanine amidase CwlA